MKEINDHMPDVPGFVKGTRVGSLIKILLYAKKNRFEAERYRSLDGKRRDVIGCLLTTRQLNHIVSQGWNELEISQLSDSGRIGVNNLKYVTGLSTEELSKLQFWNDNHERSQILDYVRKELAVLK